MAAHASAKPRASKDLEAFIEISSSGAPPRHHQNEPLLRHHNLRIAVERSRRSEHRHRARSRARRNRRSDVGIGLHRECCLLAVERDAARSTQAVAENEYALPSLAGRGYGLHEWTEIVRELEDRAKAKGFALVSAYSAERSGAVEIAIGTLRNRVKRTETTRSGTIPTTRRAESVKSSKLAFRSDLIDAASAEGSPRSRPASYKCSIEVPIAAQRQRCAGVPQVSIWGEVVQDGVAAARCDFEYDSITMGAANFCTNKIALGVFGNRVGITAVEASTSLEDAEVVDHRIFA